MKRALHSSRRYLVAAMLLAIGSLIAMTLWSSRLAYLEKLNDAASQRQALAVAADARLSGSLRVIDRLLQDMVNERLRTPLTEQARLTAYLTERKGFLPEVKNLFLTDSDGIIRVSSLESVVGSDISNRAYFTALTRGDSNFYLSAPFVAVTQATVLVAAKPIRAAQGRFLGLAAVVIPAEYIVDILQHASPDAGGSIMLFGSDLHIRMRLPEAERHAGQTMHGAPGVTEHLRGGNRNSEHRFIARLDGVERLATIRTLSFPTDLHLSVTMDASAVLAPWRNQTRNLSLLAGIVLLVLILLLWVAFRLRRDVAQRERQLLAKANDLLLLEQAVNRLGIGVSITDSQGRLRYANPAEARLYGLTWDELLAGGRDQLLVPTAELAGATAIVGKERECRHRRKDGTHFIARLISENVQDETGRCLGVITLCEDISERKQIETDLIAARETAQAASAAKNLFLANMSHELRTPLNGVLGMLQLLETTPLDPNQREFLHIASSSAWDLLTLLNELLDLSSIEAGRLRLAGHDFALTALVADSVQLFRQAATSKGLQLTTEIAPELPDTLHGDAFRLRQILLNLLGNAVKFTPAGCIAVSVRGGCAPTPTASGSVVFSIRDSGIGIAAEELARIFEPFEQADSSFQKSFQGAGLGLTIVKQLTELMDGSVRMTSGLGSGTCVEIELPLLPPQPRC